MNRKQLIVGWVVGVYLAMSIITPLYADESKAKDKIIKDIQEKFSTINAESYREVSKDLMDRSTEGGSLIGYFEGDKLRRIVATLYGEMGKWIREYYFWEESLIFAFTQYLHYVYPVGLDIPVNFENPVSEDIGKITENRYYFKNDKMISWLDSEGKEVDVGNPEFKKREMGAITEAKEFMGMLQ